MVKDKRRNKLKAVSTFVAIFLIFGQKKKHGDDAVDIETVRRRGRTKDADIVSKDQRWHCRNRITLVFGSNDVEELDTYIYGENGLEFKTVKFHQAKSKAVEEILDNCIDEYYRGHVTEIHTSFSSTS